MSPMPVGWSVGVEGTRVVIRVSGRPDDWFWLSTAEIETLMHHLQFARLVARRRELAESDQDAISSAVQRDIDAHLKMYDRYKVGELDQVDIDAPSHFGAPATSVGPDGSEDAVATDVSGSATTSGRGSAGLPEGWDIRRNGETVRFGFPASAADGEFQISRSEAAALGIALLLVISPQEWADLLNGSGFDRSDEERGSSE